ncbi:unnamed protein product [Staurois parvus]|uniref:Uncharacterized protein n=1 Tax=Staurois parvus TaxID=386267 RepID=A0ABN9CZ68_9NEOB|nr:unnamed protein product [Staurois parvus]
MQGSHQTVLLETSPGKTGIVFFKGGDSCQQQGPGIITLLKSGWLTPGSNECRLWEKILS